MKKMVYGTVFVQSGDAWQGSYLDNAGNRYSIVIYPESNLWRGRWICMDCDLSYVSTDSGATMEEMAAAMIQRIPTYEGNPVL